MYGLSWLILSAAAVLSAWHCELVYAQSASDNAGAQDVPFKPAHKCGLFPGAEVVSKVSNVQSFPGFGWDNLRNLPMAAVFDMFKYDKCRLTPDRLHVVPDNVDVVPVKESYYDRFAHYYKDMNDYHASTKQSINLGVGYDNGKVGISGSFSKQFQQTKRTIYTSATSVLKTSFTYHAYTLIAEPDSALSDNFKSRVLEIGDMLRRNRTNMAEYLAEVLVRDFGTNVITRIDAGAHITQEDFMDSKTILEQEANLDQFRAASAANFLNFLSFNIGGGKTVSDAANKTFQENTKHSTLKSVGGLDLLSVSDASRWLNISIANLVALDRTGDPIYWHITEALVPELPTMINLRIAKMVQNAVEKYYKKNTVEGCMDLTAPNYRYLANKPDGSCHQPFDNMTFGGMYQTCNPVFFAPDGQDYSSLCEPFRIVNGITGTPACPADYVAEEIVSSVASGTSQYVQACTKEYYLCWKYWYTFGGKKCLKSVCHTQEFVPKLEYKIFWCNAAKEIKGNEGYLYGGSFAKGQLNPFTNEQSCPGSFFKQTYGINEDQFTMCLSRDYQMDSGLAIPFAGFTTGSNIGMPTCAQGYSQHLLMHTVEDREVYVCIRTGMKMRDPEYATVHRPPFRSIPDDFQANLAMHAFSDGRLWVYNETSGQWIHGQDQSLTADLALQAYVTATKLAMEEL